MLTALIGLGLVVFGVVLLARPDQLVADLHTEAALGWVAILVGAPVLLASLVTPWRSRL